MNDAAPLLETTTAELSTTLPLNSCRHCLRHGTPDWQSFIVLQPGFRAPLETATRRQPWHGRRFANGSMPFSTAMLDGA